MENGAAVKPGKRVFVAVPSLDDTVRVATMTNILEFVCDALMFGWGVKVKGFVGLPLHTTRNRILETFRQSDCTDLLWWDDDVSANAGAAINLLKSEKDFIAGVYPHRGDPISFPVRWLTGDPEQQYEVEPESGLIKVEGIGFGFVRLTRRCVERMIEAYPELEYKDVSVPGGKMHRLFQFKIYEDVEWSEDMTFCRRWREIGGEVWVDPDISFLHIGNKGFVGNLKMWLLENQRAASAEAQRQKRFGEIVGSLKKAVLEAHVARSEEDGKAERYIPRKV